MSHRVFGGAVVLLSLGTLVRVIGFVSLVVLSRLMTPDQFGFAMMAVVVVEVTQAMTDLQVTSALIRMPRIDRPKLDTAFTLSVLRGVVAALFLVAAADPIAGFFDQPGLAVVIQALAAVPLLDGLRSPAFAHFARELDYRQEFRVVGIAKVATLIVTVGIAAATGSFWALVVGTILNTAVITGLTYRASPYRPRFRLDGWREFIGFGGWLSLAGLINGLAARTSSLIVGSSFSPAVFGRFNLGVQMASMATNQIGEALKRALFSGFSRSERTPQDQRGAYERAQLVILAVALPLGILLSACAREIVVLSAGPRWIEASQVLRICAIPMALGLLAAGVEALLTANAHTRSIFVRNLVNFAVLVAMLWAGLRVAGLTGLLVGWAATALFYIALTLWFAKRSYGYGAGFLVRDGWRIWLAGAGAGAVALAMPAWDGPMLVVGTALVLKAAAITATYGAIVWTAWRLAGAPAGVESFSLEMLAAVRRHARSFRG